MTYIIKVFFFVISEKIRKYLLIKKMKILEFYFNLDYHHFISFGHEIGRTKFRNQ